MTRRLPIWLPVAAFMLPGIAVAASHSDPESSWAAVGLHVLSGVRDAPESSAMVTLSGTGEEIFNADSFRFGGQPGGQIDFSIGLAPGWGFSAAYRRFVSFSDDRFLPAPGSVYLYGQTPAESDLALEQTYDSEFQDAEIDFGYEMGPWVRLHGGIRFLQIDDGLDVEFIRSGFSATIRTETTNVLLGLQFGADLRLWRKSASRGEVTVLVGALRNDLRGSMVLENPAGEPTSTAEDDVQPHSAMAELGFRVLWPVSPRWTLLLALEGLWVDHVADASSQPVVTDNLLSASPRMRLDDGGDLLLPTLSFGFEVRF